MTSENESDQVTMELMEAVCHSVEWRFQSNDLGFLQILWRRLSESGMNDISKYRDLDSGYSALHHAVFDGNLDILLFLLRGDSNRFVRRPMELLYSTSDPLTCAIDYEGLTAAGLLGRLQVKELRLCRESIQRKISVETGRRSRSNSWWDELQRQQESEQNELEGLARSLRRLSVVDEPAETIGTQTTYGCEVFTFGSAHHCALGVVSGSQQTKSGTLRPQRVHSEAVAVSCASHHTLTITKAGHLFAFGLGKGGRLGTGDENPRPTPVRIPMRQTVIAIAAAENHSLIVTKTGHVFAFGSNRFGQLGGDTPGGIKCSPRRVDDLKQSPCVDVAAGARHSVALSQRGEVYVWGDNSAGQLGISVRNSNSIHKVQRVEALWKHSHGAKAAIAIAASEQSTLALTPRKHASGNSIYAWGHGNHVPIKVQFDTKNRSRPINPVAISSARYHNVAITSDGEVYSWGLHADSLGTKKRKQSNADKAFFSLSAPQLVTGMLPENGGGLAVAVSASENHTAVVTEEGHLFTWGDTYAQDILGHEGVRWQPDPKRVAGVHRAVAVSAAKEHTALLIGTTFPVLPTVVPGIASLADLSAKCIAEEVDLFNVLPVLIMAERTQSSVLLEYCKEFLRRNLDGVLNVAQRSVVNMYLNEQLNSAALTRDEDRDGRYHPLVVDVLLAGSQGGSFFMEERLCAQCAWETACKELAADPRIDVFCATSIMGSEKENTSLRRMNRSRSRSFGDTRTDIRQRASVSDRCNSMISDMDLSTRVLAEAKLVCLSKEVRAIRKRLSQISKLESGQPSDNPLSLEQKQKLARKPQLEAELLKFEPAIEAVQKRLACFVPKDVLVSESLETDKTKELDTADSSECKDDALNASEQITRHRCDVCNVTCSDRENLEVHFAGRKHRNRCAQAEQDEKNQAALATAQQQQRQQLSRSSQVLSQQAKPRKEIGWSTKKPQSIQPSFILPPPPHPVQDLVPTNKAGAFVETVPKKSLRDIMAEESKLSAASVVWPSPGPVKPLQSPPWARGNVVSVTTTAANAGAPAIGSYLLGDFLTQEPNLASPVKNSLGDFLTQEPNLASPVKTRWGTISPEVKVKKSPTISFRDIQEQEEEFVTKQDHSYASAGKWFVERKERAGSFKEIQNEAAALLEHEQLVEEQMKIETQIYREIAAKKAEEEKKARSKQGEKKGKRNSKKRQRTSNRQMKSSPPKQGNRQTNEN